MTYKPAALSILICVAGLCGAPAMGQGDTDQLGNKVDEVILDDIKLAAQQTALPFLKGENPFILRESSWSGTLEPGKARLIQVQLFRRNEYHFWFNVPDRRAGLNLNIYDANGEIVDAENVKYESSNIVSLVVRPGVTGIYYLRVSLQTTIETPQRWSVIYAYR